MATNSMGTWEKRTPGFWIFQPSDDEDFYFSMEANRFSDE
jgi:hypothetical protein